MNRKQAKEGAKRRKLWAVHLLRWSSSPPGKKLLDGLKAGKFAFLDKYEYRFLTLAVS